MGSVIHSFHFHASQKDLSIRYKNRRRPCKSCIYGGRTGHKLIVLNMRDDHLHRQNRYLFSYICFLQRCMMEDIMSICWAYHTLSIPTHNNRVIVKSYWQQNISTTHLNLALFNQLFHKYLLNIFMKICFFRSVHRKGRNIL